MIYILLLLAIAALFAFLFAPKVPRYVEPAPLEPRVTSKPKKRPSARRKRDLEQFTRPIVTPSPDQPLITPAPDAESDFVEAAAMLSLGTDHHSSSHDHGSSFSDHSSYDSGSSFDSGGSFDGGGFDSSGD